MKKKLIKYIFIVLLGMTSCKQKNNFSENANVEKIIKQKVIDTLNSKVTKVSIINTVSKISQNSKTLSLESHLKNKVKRLAKLKNNYELKDIGLIEIEQSRLLGRLKKLKKANFTKLKEIEEIDVKKIKSQIYESRQSFLKATKSMKPNGNTFPRVKIEEYIFKNKEDVFKVLSKLREIDRIWYMISKEPNSMFLEDNRLYYIISGGWYMMNMYKEIENEIKN